MGILNNQKGKSSSSSSSSIKHVDHKIRKKCFKNRIEGFVKKFYELRKLCDVKAVGVVHSEFNNGAKELPANPHEFDEVVMQFNQKKMELCTGEEAEKVEEKQRSCFGNGYGNPKFDNLCTVESLTKIERDLESIFVMISERENQLKAGDVTSPSSYSPNCDQKNDFGERKALKEEKPKEEKYMWAFVDGEKEKVGNFRVEPPGLFRGRGEHPKMGKLKRRIRPDEITINIGKGEPVPECPIPNERWKEVKHDNTVTWLAFWKNPIDPKAFKYVFLDDTSSWKGQSDKEKYEKARLLKDYILNIRANYRKDFKNKDPIKQQIAVAAYLIDILALRAGNEKDDDEADTVGCCTLKVENVSLVPQTHKLEINFLGKDSIKYENTVEVDPLVYKAIGGFKKGKNIGEELFDKLDTYKLNAHLKELMPGLTAKLLNSEIMGGNVAEKVVFYNHANKEVAKLCNHQRSEPKSHGAQMLKLRDNIVKLKGVLDGLETDLHRVRKGKGPVQLDADDGKSKKNFTLQIFNKSLLAKFAWAMDVDPSFRF
ncbi:hypothetical protein MKW98_018014 [Papaver atlanticum]|uniref:DNA topoisomerase n=1 Tax=Papaver atlanticum TaxID=357466 RepID=A0AAD4TFF7_9MAGN|nr:hypothetical protein MKW98_018014 [Papaver atlanticum]